MFSPIPLNLPACHLRLTREGKATYVFDELRRKKVVLTPEEWVRQHWIHHLHTDKKYPYPLMKTEGGFVLNSLLRRTDLLIYNRHGEKILLAEFKAPTVKISEKVFKQITNYNIIHKIPLLLVSNGVEHYYCSIDFESKSWRFIPEIPPYCEDDHVKYGK